MKRILTIAAALAMAVCANAQVNFGVKGALNLSTNDVYGNSSKMAFGFNAGAVAEYDLAKTSSATFALRGEALYSMQGVKTDGAVSVGPISVSGSSSTTLGYVAVPVLAEVKILDELISLYAGPQFGFMTNNKTDGSLSIGGIGGSNSSSSDSLKKFDFGVAVGGTFMLLDNVGLDARYTFGMTGVFPGSNDTYNGKNGVASIGAVLFF